MTLVFKIKQYVGSLDAKIGEEQNKAIEKRESMEGLFAAERESAYLAAKEAFYKLFPEVLGEYRKL